MIQMIHKRILATGPLDDVAVQLLKTFGDVIIAPDNCESTLLSLLDGTIALVVRGVGPISAKLIHAAPELRVIGRSGAGYSNVDIPAATAHRIPVVYTPGMGARAIAEAAITFMLALCKRLTYWDQQLKTGNWNSRFESQPGDLDGAILGIIGLGRIGQTLAELAQSFHMTILASDPYVDHRRAAQLGVEMVNIEELLCRSDFISIHCAETKETSGLINRERIRLVKPGTYLVNLSRGSVIESLDVLYEALQNGSLAGVGLDVFEPEPPDVSHPLFKLTNCITAPHALGMTNGAMKRIFRSMAEDMAAVLQGKRPKFVVNPEVFDSPSDNSDTRNIPMTKCNR